MPELTLRIVLCMCMYCNAIEAFKRYGDLVVAYTENRHEISIQTSKENHRNLSDAQEIPTYELR